LRNKRLPHGLNAGITCPSPPKRISAAERELYWETTNGHGREKFLDALVKGAKRSGWPGDFYGCWVPWDVELIADLWHHVPVRTATEELGWPRRFTRVRWATKATRLASATVAGVCIWCAFAVLVNAPWAMVLGLSCGILLLGVLALSRIRCLHAAGRLIWQAAEEAQLTRQRTEQTSRIDPRPAERQRSGRAKSRTPVYAANSGQ
jgi:hypothetical protein